MGAMPSALAVLNKEVMNCTRCPRLVAYREQIGREKRRAYRDHEYWARPVPGFGDPHARVLVLGLAPGAHGSNRTGRPFTGDASGKFMYPILYKVGIRQPAERRSSRRRTEADRLLHHGRGSLRAARQQAAAVGAELIVRRYLDRELAILKDVKVVVALGKIGFDAYLAYLKRNGVVQRTAGYKFGHAASYPMPNGVVLLASYHPSNQNTATGKLTATMFEDVFRKAKKIAASAIDETAN